MSTFRTLTWLSLIATIGSFVIGVYAFVVDYGRPPAASRNASPQPRERPAPEPLPADQPVCSPEVYAPIMQRLREAYAQSGRQVAIAPAWLGADVHFDYFYDFARDEVICVGRERQDGVAVSGKPQQGPAEPFLARPFVVLGCILLILFCLASIAVTRWLRRRNARKGQIAEAGLIALPPAGCGEARAQAAPKGRRFRRNQRAMITQ